MVRHYCHGLTISTRPSLVLQLFKSIWPTYKVIIWDIPLGFPLETINKQFILSLNHIIIELIWICLFDIYEPTVHMHRQAQ